MLARRVMGLAVVVMGSMALGGCLERMEAVTVRADGSALVRSEFRGTPGDFKKTVDALPEAGGAWRVTQREEKDPDGKTRVIRVAELDMAAGGAMPGTYAAAGDGREASGLAFPTRVRVTRTGPNTYIDFERTYVRRERAKYQYREKLLTETDAIKKLEGKDPIAMSDVERQLLLRTLARVEAEKAANYVEAGAREMENKGLWTQDIGLILRQTCLAFADDYAIAKAEGLLKQAASPERDRALEQEAQAYRDGLHGAVKAQMDTMMVSAEQQDLFIAAAKREMQMHQATEDLADERWEVRLTMPGTLAAHNADRVENGVLVWAFKADAIMDRNQVLKATSWVEGKGER